uniref:Uncharacterized protein n=1 Tax=Coccidioides posadasii RMSCC 3488 TaxID=454284 RepID=A0A0J6I9J3_COCPO|nr:hypothetical protein CPAG_04603 [Coccidioides posadasii RMSCC 3488]
MSLKHRQSSSVFSNDHKGFTPYSCGAFTAAEASTAAAASAVSAVANTGSKAVQTVLYNLCKCHISRIDSSSLCGQFYSNSARTYISLIVSQRVEQVKRNTAARCEKIVKNSFANYCTNFLLNLSRNNSSILANCTAKQSILLLKYVCLQLQICLSSILFSILLNTAENNERKEKKKENILTSDLK